MYGFYIYEDEDRRLVPSEIFETESVEPAVKALENNPVVVVPDKDKKHLWFFAETSDTLNAYAMGMSYGIVDLTPENWKNMFYV